MSNIRSSRMLFAGILAALFSCLPSSRALAQDTRPPRLKNPEKVRSELLDKYPLEMRMRGISGEARVRVVVNRDGEPVGPTIEQTSGIAVLDTAALEIARDMRFDPARQSGEKVETSVVLPLNFATFCGTSRSAVDEPEWVRVIPNRWKEEMYRLYPEDEEPTVSPTALLQMTIDSVGKPTRVGILGSTGSPVADSVAMRMGRLSSFAPIRWDDRAVSGRFRFLASAAPPRPPSSARACRQTTEPRLINLGPLRRDFTAIMRVAWKSGVELPSTARAMIFVGPDGKSRQVHITHSSCWPDLDRYLQALYKAAVFEPPTCDGEPVGSWLILPVHLGR